jgi:hypothetical protein
MTIIVSAFLENVNKRKDRNTEKYFEYGKKLLSVPIQKIIFMDENCFDMFKIFQNDYTIIIPFKKKNMYFYEKEYFDKITKFHINSTCPEKDTLEYMFTICYKSEFVKQAIEYYTKYYKKTYESEQFIWIDFGINHVMKCSDTEFQQKIINMCFKNYDNVRIASIWDVNCNYSIDIYKDISWYFAGGIFGGDSRCLIKFANLVKDKCIEIIRYHNTIMWEVNIWSIIYKENIKLFSLYKCDHNNSIIDNY